MRVLLGILAVLLGGLNASAQKKVTIGLDMAETLKSGDARIVAGYGFHERWSVGFDTSVGTALARGSADPEYEAHNGEFVPSKEKEATTLSTGISVRYWPAHTYRGPYAEIGCRFEYRSRPCCIAAAGYCIPIWKGLSATLSVSTDIGPSSGSVKGIKECMAMEICWTFGNL